MTLVTRKSGRIARLLAARVGPLLALVLWLPLLRRLDLLLALIGLVVWMVAEALSEDETSNRVATRSADDRGSRSVILGVHIASYWLPFVELGFLRVPPVRWSLIAPGLLLIAGGAILRVVAVRTLGRYFTAHVHVADDQPICRSGIYGYIRHPSYVGLLLLNVGPSVATGAWASLGAALAMTLVATRIRVQVEEAALIRGGGTAYEEYCRTVRRWVPSQ